MLSRFVFRIVDVNVARVYFYLNFRIPRLSANRFMRGYFLLRILVCHWCRHLRSGLVLLSTITLPLTERTFLTIDSWFT